MVNILRVRQIFCCRSGSVFTYKISPTFSGGSNRNVGINLRVLIFYFLLWGVNLFSAINMPRVFSQCRIDEHSPPSDSETNLKRENKHNGGIFV